MLIDIFEVQADRMYFRNHLWASVADDVVTLGVDDFVQKMAGLVQRVELPPLGDSLASGQNLVKIQYRTKVCSGGLCTFKKEAKEFQSPIAGVVADINKAVLDQPTLLQEDPYSGGWLIKLTVPAARETLMQQALSPDEVGGWLQEEIVKQRDEVDAIRAEWT